jgi:hypothetical protein
MQPLNIPSGETVFLGAPENPMDPAVIRSIAALVASRPGIVEAHSLLGGAPAAWPVGARKRHCSWPPTKLKSDSAYTLFLLLHLLATGFDVVDGARSGDESP